jgi:hypothetical protein
MAADIRGISYREPYRKEEKKKRRIIVHPITGHEGSEGSTGIALSFFYLGALCDGLSTPRRDRFIPEKDQVPTV